MFDMKIFLRQIKICLLSPKPKNKVRTLNLDTISDENVKHILLLIQAKTTRLPGSSGPGAIYDELPFPELSLAPTRRQDAAKRFNLYTQALADYLNLFWRDKRILDIGCASGDMTFRLAQAQAQQIIGLDYDYEALRIAEAVRVWQKMSNIHFVQGNFVTNFLHFPNQPLDIILCLSVIHWLLRASTEKALINAFRNLHHSQQVLLYEGSLSQKPSHKANFPYTLEPDWIKTFWSKVGFTKFAYLGNLTPTHQLHNSRPLWLIW